MRFKNNLRGKSKRWWTYFLIGTLGSFIVGMWASTLQSPVAKFFGILLWFFLLMIGFTGTSERKKG